MGGTKSVDNSRATISCNNGIISLQGTFTLSGTNKGGIMNLCALPLGRVAFAAICRAEDLDFPCLGPCSHRRTQPSLCAAGPERDSHSSLCANVHARARKRAEEVTAAQGRSRGVALTRAASDAEDAFGSCGVASPRPAPVFSTPALFPCGCLSQTPLLSSPSSL